ncbi:hypothetical protein GGI20_004320 [Coemansia sp. BCRC 34301]|nr:hypothetical protein GGI20_004320 [Coemansia sp. BCRC 34301]
MDMLGQSPLWPESAVDTSAEINTNIGAFVQRIGQIAPKVCKIEVVGGSTYVDDFRNMFYFESLVAQLFRLAPRLIYKYVKDTAPLDLRVVSISSLVCIDITTNCVESVVQLARQNAATLQSLTIDACTSGDVSGLIQDTSSDYVEYSCLRYLRLKQFLGLGKPEHRVFPGAVPFPNLRLLSIANVYPFGDEVAFRRNAATLECLEFQLDHSVAALLTKCRMFTRTSHPKPQCVKTGMSCNTMSHSFASVANRIGFSLSIGPSTAVRAIRGITFCVGLFPMLAKHGSIQVLVLPDTQLDFWDVIGPIKTLPLLSDLYSKEPMLGALPLGVSAPKFPAYVVSRYVPMGKLFWCWHPTYGREADLGQVVTCCLVLALLCPNFDYCDPPRYRRKRLMALMAKAIDSDEFKIHALRLQRLLLLGLLDDLP